MHPELTPDSRYPEVLTGTLDFAGRKVSLRIDPDGGPVDECMTSALLAVQSLPEIDAKAREVAAAKLLPAYNDDWRHYMQQDADGHFQNVDDPELTPAAFKDRLVIKGIEAMGPNSYTIHYGDDDMFAGHSIFVTSFDGLAFLDAHAELFG